MTLDPNALPAGSPHPEELDRVLAGPEPLLAALRWVLSRGENVSGSIHRLDADGLLHLAAQVGLPESMLPVIETIPVGKGMAGLAAERRAPVSLCNLQTDTSGDARPGAKATGLRGTVALPLLDESGALVGVLGVGRPEEHAFEGAELAFLEHCAARIARYIAAPAGPGAEE